MPFGFFGFFHTKYGGEKKVYMFDMSPMPFGFFGFFHQTPWDITMK